MSMPTPNDESVVRPCPKCGQKLLLAPELHGRRVRCKACGIVMLVSSEPWGLSVVDEPPAVPPDAPPAVPPPLPSGEGPPPLEVDPLDFPPARGTKAIRFGPLVIVGVVLVIVLFAGLIAATMLSGGGSSTALRYVPDGSMGIVSVNVPAILNSGVFRRIENERPGDVEKFRDTMQKATGLSPEDVSRMTVAVDPADMDQPFMIVEFVSAVDQQAILKKAPERSWREEKQGDYTIHTGGSFPPMSVCFTDARTALIGPSEKVKAVLGREGGPKLSGTLQSCIDGLDFSQAVVGAGLMPSQMPDARGMPEEAAMAMRMAQDMPRGIEAGTFEVGVGRDVDVSLSVVCQDEKSAVYVKRQIDGRLAMLEQWVASQAAEPDGSMAMPDELRELLNSINLSQSGREVRARITIDEQTIRRGMNELP